MYLQRKTKYPVSLLVGFAISIVMIFFAIYVLGSLIVQAQDTPKTEFQQTYRHINIVLSLFVILIILTSLILLQYLAKLYCVFMESALPILSTIFDYSTRFLACVPTPLLLILLVPTDVFSSDNKYFRLLLFGIFAVACSLPTASQIARDGFSGYSKKTYMAAKSLGLSKHYALLEVVSIEHQKLFSIAAITGLVRVISENWILITNNTSLNIGELLNAKSLPEILEQSYSKINENLSFDYIAILLILTFLGKALGKAQEEQQRRSSRRCDR